MSVLDVPSDAATPLHAVTTSIPKEHDTTASAGLSPV
jgi:hypothetical protein